MEERHPGVERCRAYMRHSILYEKMLDEAEQEWGHFTRPKYKKTPKKPASQEKK